MPDVTPAAFGAADLTLFRQLDQLGLEVTGQRLEPGRSQRVAGPALEIGRRTPAASMAGIARQLGTTWRTAWTSIAPVADIH